MLILVFPGKAAPKHWDTPGKQTLMLVEEEETSFPGNHPTRKAQKVGWLCGGPHGGGRSWNDPEAQVRSQSHNGVVATG